VLDAELVEPARPLLEFAAVGDAERHVVEPDPELAEVAAGRRRRVLMKAEQLPLADHVHGVVEVGLRVLVQHGRRVQQPLVPRNTDGQVAHRERDMVQPGERCHGVSFLFAMNGSR